MYRRLISVLAFSTAALLAAVFAHPAGADAARRAPAKPAAASPAPSPSPSATPEPLDQAIPRLEAKLKSNPNDNDATAELAGDYLAINRPDLALPLTQKLLTAGQKSARVYYMDGVAQGSLGRQKEALADLEQAANLEPTNPGVLGMLTNLYLEQNRPQDAERVAKRAVTFNAKDVNALNAYGAVLSAEGKYDDARKQFEAAQTVDPKDVRPLLLEAQTYLRQKAFALADQMYDRALAIDPNSMPTLIAKAQLAAQQHNVQSAIATYQKIYALQTDAPDKVAVLDQEAGLYAAEKMDGQADATFRKAIADFPNVLQAHTAYADYLVARNDKAGAERELVAGAGPNRDQPDAVARLGQLYASENAIPKAIDQFKRLTQIVPNDPRSHLLLAASYAANKQFDKARDEYKTSYNLQHTPDALLGLGQADLQTHQYAECVQVYDAIDKGAPDLSKQNPAILYGLGQCYEKSNQRDKARGAYAKLLSYLKPGSQGANEVKALIENIDRQNKPKPKATPKPKSTAKH